MLRTSLQSLIIGAKISLSAAHGTEMTSAETTLLVITISRTPAKIQLSNEGHPIGAKRQPSSSADPSSWTAPHRANSQNRRSV